MRRSRYCSENTLIPISPRRHVRPVAVFCRIANLRSIRAALCLGRQRATGAGDVPPHSPAKRRWRRCHEASRSALSTGTRPSGRPPPSAGHAGTREIHIRMPLRPVRQDFPTLWRACRLAAGSGIEVAGFGRFAASGGRPDAETASFGPERRFVFRISGPGWRFAVKKN